MKEFKTVSSRVLSITLLLILAGCRSPGETESVPLSDPGELLEARGAIEARELEQVRDYLTERIESAITRLAIPSIAIGLYDAEGVLWADGFGLERVEDEAKQQVSVPASHLTVYRVGSVSKLFTDIAVMQLVEQGKLDLDAPITDVLPEFEPENPFGAEITMRQLMCHRAGLVREPPIGNYFDDSEPSLEQTVKSLNTTRLVHEPGTTIKYSNAGIAVVGYALEVLSGKPFDVAVREAVLDPLGMSSSDFVPSNRVSPRLAQAKMRSFDRRRLEAPTFELGMAPAGSLYSTVTDLGRFTQEMLAPGQLLKPDTLEEMFTPQFADPEATSGFGLGFAVRRLADDQGEVSESSPRWLGHNGAIYGFSTSLLFLPEQRIGVAITSSLDVSNGLIAEIADEAIRLLLDAQATAVGDQNPALRERLAALRSLHTDPISARLAQELEGYYEGEGTGFELLVRTTQTGAPSLWIDLRDRRFELRTRATDKATFLIGDDEEGRTVELEVAATASGEPTQLVSPTRSYTRAKRLPPAPAPAHLRAILGEYRLDEGPRSAGRRPPGEGCGTVCEPVVLFERGGQLWALFEWMEQTPLRALEDDGSGVERWAIDSGMYVGEEFRVKRGGQGGVTRAWLGPVAFVRRALGAASGETFHIDPVRPVSELREVALTAQPSKPEAGLRDSDLVDLTSLDDSIALDVRYATTNNFMQTVFYDEPRAFLQRPAAEALVRAHQALRAQGYGLLIHDAYRPWYVTKMFWDATPEDKKIFVANPENGSRHNRGCAVDLTLFDLETGQPVEMVGGYDEMTDRSFPDYLGGTERQRHLREVLRKAMEAQGFSVYEFEWWHFDYKDWEQYAVQNQVFSEL